MKKYLFFILLILLGWELDAQVLTLNGTALTPSGGTPGTCVAGGYRAIGQASVSGSCVSLTQNAFESGAIWVCDPIDLNQSFKLNFEANFGAFNSGDGIAFVLQREAVPSVIGGAGGGMGYSVGNAANCQGGNCLVDSSIVVEFDTWDNTADPWDGSNPGLGNIDDISCDHASIQTDGIQLASNTLVAPACLLPAGAAVTNGTNYDVCIIWDVVLLQYQVYFDGVLILTYSGDIRNQFSDPSSVFWGFTGGSGGANQNQSICNATMLTNVVAPSCVCAAPVATASPSLLSICSGETTNVVLSSSLPGTTYSWSAANNTNVSGESLLAQSNDTIINTLVNNAGTSQVVSYTITPDVAGCIGADITVDVTVSSEVDITVNRTNTCPGSTDGELSATVTGGNPGYTFAWSTGESTALVTGLTAGAYSLTVTDINGCLATSIEMVDTFIVPATVISSINTCPGSADGELSATVTGGAPNYTFNWSNGESTAIISGLAVGTYSLTVTDSNGCLDTESGAVNTFFAPTLAATISADSIPFGGQGVLLDVGNDESNLSVTYLWSATGVGNANIETVNSPQTNTNPDASGFYTYFVEATSADGCTTEDTLFLLVTELPTPELPNAFTPNGDTRNDVFKVLYLDQQYLLDFKVFNRWGTLIYNDTSTGVWDGTAQGLAQPSGVYMYVISWQLPREEVKVIRGSLNLIR